MHKHVILSDVFKPLMHRSGLNCGILEGGTVRIGDMIRPA